MNPLQLFLLGAVAGVVAGLVILLGAIPFAGFARAQRASLAGTIGGTIGFFLTALIQGPFYGNAKTLSDLAEPMGLSALVALGAAGLCAMMILRAGRT